MCYTSSMVDYTEAARTHSVVTASLAERTKSHLNQIAYVGPEIDPAAKKLLLERALENITAAQEKARLVEASLRMALVEMEA